MSAEPTWPSSAPVGKSRFVNLIRAVTPAGSGAARPSWIACGSGLGGRLGPLPPAAMAIAVPPPTTITARAAKRTRLPVESVRKNFTALLVIPAEPEKGVRAVAAFRPGSGTTVQGDADPGGQLRFFTGKTLVAALVAACAVFAGLLLSARHGRSALQPVRASTAVRAAPRRVRRTPIHVLARRTSRLGDAVQNASAVALDRTHAMLLGGLTAADTSTDSLRVVSARSDSSAGRLPVAVHDSAAAQLGSSTYLFGGGNGIAQLDRDRPRLPAAAAAHRRPAARRELGLSSRGHRRHRVRRRRLHRARWLDTIVAWNPGATRASRGASALAASATRRSRPPAAGSSSPAARFQNGTASDAVLEYQPATGTRAPSSAGCPRRPRTRPRDARRRRLRDRRPRARARHADRADRRGRYRATRPRSRGRPRCRSRSRTRAAATLGDRDPVAGGRSAPGHRSLDRWRARAEPTLAARATSRDA